MPLRSTGRLDRFACRHDRSPFASKRLLTLLLFGVVVGVTGCGGGGPDYPTATISGTVNVNGTPVDEGTLTFLPTGAKLGNGGTAEIVGGNYTAKQVPIGENVFTFYARVKTGKMIPGPSGAPEPEWKMLIPVKYQTEGIAREISESGTQDFSIE